MHKKYQTSLYTIFIALEDGSGDYLLVHGYTGAIDHVTGNVADVLRKGARVTENEIDNLNIQKGTFDTLVKRGYITSMSPMEEKERVRHMADVFHKRDSVSKNFLFLVAYDCNFRCPYCFENAISNNGKGWSKKVFTKEAVDRAYEAMLELEPNRTQHRNEIILYGGEPLLKQNKEIVEYIVSEGVKRNYTFRAITNGYDLEHFLHLLEPGKIESLQISIDGTPEKHDARRTHYLDGNSFDKIVENMGLVLKQDVRISTRINTDLSNFDDINALHAIFREKGLFEFNNFSVYSALVHGSTNDNMNCNAIMSNSNPPVTEKKKKNNDLFEVIDPGVYDPDGQYINFEAEEKRYVQSDSDDIKFHYTNGKNDFDEVDKIQLINRGKYIDMYHEAVEDNADLHQISCQDFGIKNTIRKVLEGKGLAPFKSVFCSAQTGMMIFDPYGDLYSCWETVGVDQYKVGSYRKEIEIFEDELENWYGKNIGKTPACSKCKYAFFCGGGCQAHALTEGRGYNSSYCDGFPKTFQKVVPKAYDEFLKKKEKTEVPV